MCSVAVFINDLKQLHQFESVFSPTQPAPPSLSGTDRNVTCLSHTVSIQIAAKNLVCPGLPVESEEICVCVWQLNVDRERERGKGGGGGREHERSRQEKEVRDGWVIRQIQIGVAV